MEDAIKQNLIRLGIRKGDTLGVAVSGGVDSMVLLNCACKLRDTLGITVAANHFETAFGGRHRRTIWRLWKSNVLCVLYGV